MDEMEIRFECLKLATMCDGSAALSDAGREAVARAEAFYTFVTARAPRQRRPIPDHNAR